LESIKEIFCDKFKGPEMPGILYKLISSISSPENNLLTSIFLHAQSMNDLQHSLYYYQGPNNDLISLNLLIAQELDKLKKNTVLYNLPDNRIFYKNEYGKVELYIIDTIVIDNSRFIADRLFVHEEQKYYENDRIYNLKKINLFSLLNESCQDQKKEKVNDEQYQCKIFIGEPESENISPTETVDELKIGTKYTIYFRHHDKKRNSKFVTVEYPNGKMDKFSTTPSKRQSLGYYILFEPKIPGPHVFNYCDETSAFPTYWSEVEVYEVPLFKYQRCTPEKFQVIKTILMNESAKRETVISPFRYIFVNAGENTTKPLCPTYIIDFWGSVRKEFNEKEVRSFTNHTLVIVKNSDKMKQSMPEANELWSKGANGKPKILLFCLMDNIIHAGLTEFFEELDKWHFLKKL